MGVKKIDHVVITAEDVEGCLAFYEKLGFQVRKGAGRHELFAGDFKINVHQKGRELEPKARFVQTGSADLCFEINGDLEQLISLMKENQIQPELGIVSRHGAKGEMESVYVRDPEGNLLEFCCYLQG